MGQTLPHGVYLPDNGERNCYTGLSQNWQKLDNLIGSHGDTVSFAQTLTEGVEIGKITINGVDVSLYHTDYSSDIASKANASDVYTKAEVDASLTAKADKATTLSGYGITDAYTKAQVDNKISGLVNSAPETLDTLNELASALGNDPNFATTVANQIGAKANDSDVVHTTGDETIGGVKTFTSNMVIQGSRKVVCNLDNSFIELDGGSTWGKGGSIVLSGKDRPSSANSVLIVSKSDTNTDILQYQNGTLAPRSDNTNDSALGTSANKWKSLYATSIFGGANNIDCSVDSQGDGWIRYSNGVQICWGSVPVAIGTTLAYDPPSTMYYMRNYRFNYAKGFSSNPTVSMCVFSSPHHPFLQVCIESSTLNIDRKLTTGSIMLSCKGGTTTIQAETSIHVQAIGRWK